MGFGISDSVVSLGAGAILPPVFFVSPRVGTITSFNTELAATAALTVSASTLTATLYTSPAGSTTWIAQETSTITLASLAVGGVITGTTGVVAVPLALGTKVAVVLTSTALISAGSAYVGAGISIV
jgi:hypothetical protein